jgi:hypothetical protein
MGLDTPLGVHEIIAAMGARAPVYSSHLEGSL